MTIWLYINSNDAGFAPNPYKGLMTMNTGKPYIRRHAKVGDWVVGVLSQAVDSTKIKFADATEQIAYPPRDDARFRIFFAMKISRKITMQEYSVDEEFKGKRPARKGSSKDALGDNIYQWNSKGVVKQLWGMHTKFAMKNDLSGEFTLIADVDWFYFGRECPTVPNSVLPFSKIGRAVKKVGGHDSKLEQWLNRNYKRKVTFPPSVIWNIGLKRSLRENQVSGGKPNAHPKMLIGIGGNPGVGKSTLMRSMMKHVKGPWTQVKLSKLLWAEHNERGNVYVLGKYSDDHVYPGTDRLSMAVQSEAVAFIRRLKKGTVLFEGDRLFNESFIRAMIRTKNLESRFVILEASKQIVDSQRRQRGGIQSASFLKGRATKNENIKQNLTDKVNTVDVGSTAKFRQAVGDLIKLIR